MAMKQEIDATPVIRGIKANFAGRGGHFGTAFD